MARMNSHGWNPYAAVKLQPHEAWRVLVDITHGDRVASTAPRRPVVGILDQAPPAPLDHGFSEGLARS